MKSSLDGHIRLIHLNNTPDRALVLRQAAPYAPHNAPPNRPPLRIPRRRKRMRLPLLPLRLLSLPQRLVQQPQHMHPRPPQQRAPRAHLIDHAADDRAREEVRADGPRARHHRGCGLLLLAAAPEDARDAGVHPEDMHGEGAGEDERGCPAPVVRPSEEGVVRADVDVEDDAGEKEGYCEDL